MKYCLYSGGNKIRSNILIDVGAEYGNYSSDMTRTIPVSGKFSSRQKLVYQSVLNVKKETEKLLINGNSIKDLSFC